MEENVKLNVARLAADLVCQVMRFNEPSLIMLSEQFAY